MKKVLLFGCVLASLCLFSCNKEKTCHCSVLGSQDVRVITLKGENCEDLKSVEYSDPVHVESRINEDLLCMEM
ncbi:MAG: hypothetical protein KBT45_06090 [Bacteroidales bacterium]|nr:hypothetical protein [Candidatus Colimorpha pelethequi]MCQ2262202.1 hypothetical protein [Bacteroidales bacterium]